MVSDGRGCWRLWCKHVLHMWVLVDFGENVGQSHSSPSLSSAWQGRDITADILQTVVVVRQRNAKVTTIPLSHFMRATETDGKFAIS